MKRSVGAIVAVVLGLAALFVGSPLEAQVQIESGATKIKFGGRVQVQAGTSTCSDYSTDGDPSSDCVRDVPAVDMFIRRARLTIDVQVNKWISARIQPEFGKINGFRLADAYGRLNLAPDAETSHARITLGHFKRPFDLFALASSTQLLTIERAVLIRGLPATSYGAITVLNRHADRDVGVMVDGGTKGDRFHYWVGAFNGGLAFENRDTNGGKQVVGRAQYRLSTGPRPVRVGVAGSLTSQPFLRANESLGGKENGAWEIFAEMGDYGGGAHLMAALVGGKNTFQNKLGDTPDLEADDEFADLITWQAMGSWKFDVESFWVEGIEPILRLTMADPNRSLQDDTVWGFTPGVQIFFDRRNKIALNWDFVSFSDGARRSENSFKARYQFHF
ncbi:MAG: porin [Gemmatimonadota bacterium]